MSKPDELLVDVAALVKSGQSNQMSLTVVTGGAVITGRLAAEAAWRQRVSDVLRDSARLGEFAAVQDAGRLPGRRSARTLYLDQTSPSARPGFPRRSAAARLSDSGPFGPIRRRAGDYAGERTPRTPVDARPADHDATGADSRPDPSHRHGDPCRASSLRARNPDW